MIKQPEIIKHGCNGCVYGSWDECSYPNADVGGHRYRYCSDIIWIEDTPEAQNAYIAAKTAHLLGGNTDE